MVRPQVPEPGFGPSRAPQVGGVGRRWCGLKGAGERPRLFRGPQFSPSRVWSRAARCAVFPSSARCCSATLASYQGRGAWKGYRARECGPATSPLASRPEPSSVWTWIRHWGPMRDARPNEAGCTASSTSWDGLRPSLSSGVVGCRAERHAPWCPQRPRVGPARNVAGGPSRGMLAVADVVTRPSGIECGGVDSIAGRSEPFDGAARY